jgi:lauroyl/myristoyl acyltransferase
MRFSSKRGRPFKGKCRLGEYSSFRKLARAYRRGFVPVYVPDQDAVLRHKVRRIEQQRAENRFRSERQRGARL